MTSLEFTQPEFIFSGATDIRFPMDRSGRAACRTVIPYLSTRWQLSPHCASELHTTVSSYSVCPISELFHLRAVLQLKPCVSICMCGCGRLLLSSYLIEMDPDRWDEAKVQGKAAGSCHNGEGALLSFFFYHQCDLFS